MELAQPLTQQPVEPLGSPPPSQVVKPPGSHTVVDLVEAVATAWPPQAVVGAVSEALAYLPQR